MNLPKDMPNAATEELLALYAAGALSEVERQAIEDRLRQGWPDGQETWDDMQSSLEKVFHSLPQEQPPAQLKERLLTRLPRAVSASVLLHQQAKPSPAGIVFQHQRDAQFVPTPYPGITMRLLHVDQQARQFSALLKVEPGAVYPHHHHDGHEECLVLEGTLLVGDIRMVAGDFQRAEPDSDHVDQWSDTGALLYINAPLSLLG